MFTILLALGVIGGTGGISPGEPSNVTTPADRVIVLSRSSGFASATHSIDPTEVKDYVIDLSPLLEPGEQFATVEIDVEAASTTRGFGIPETGSYAVAEVDDSHIRIWPQIDLGQQGAQAWAASGTVCRFEVTAVTNSLPPRKWQRTAQITVAEK